MEVYAIEVISKKDNSCRVSSECYLAFEKAVEFIKSRSDEPSQENPYTWIEKRCIYNIRVLTVIA